MRLTLKKIIVAGVLIAVSTFVLYQIFSIKSSVQKTLAETQARLETQTHVPFEKKVLKPHLSQNVQILQNANATRDFVKFRGFYFAATNGGLVQYTEDGKLMKHFTVLDGLPESDLTTLIVWKDTLYIGTRTNNLVTFDGETFENYVWKDRKAQAVTSFLEADEKLLIGTFDGGLLDFDGKNFTEIRADDKRISAIISLYKDGAKLYVGTFDKGLWIYQSDVWAHFTTTEGLPSNRVVGITAKDKNLYVATDFGLSVLQEKTFRTLTVTPSITSLILSNNQLLIVKDDGEIVSFDDSIKEFSKSKQLQNARLIAMNEKVWLVSNKGISEIKNSQIKVFGQTDDNSLTDNFVSALAFDGKENLWVGTFRNGFDVFSASGRKLKHLESETVREINFLRANDNGVSAATSSGFLNFKSDFSVESLTKKDGLPSDSINHFSGDSFATAKGLAFKENGKIRVLSTVQNLPNNSTYTTLQVGKKLYVGTLGGLAEIENNRVVRTFKDSNSSLATNWITALCAANERIFIGTYGGGVFELLPSGEIRSFAAETGKFTVNPNAIFSDGTRLYAGTLTGAKILDLQTQEWKTITNVLPSETVLSVTGDTANVYFGTTNGIARIEKSYFESGEMQ